MRDRGETTNELVSICFPPHGRHGLPLLDGLPFSGDTEHQKPLKIVGEILQPDLGHIVIEVDPIYFRPTEVESLIGDASKAGRELGWKHKIKFHELVKEMVQEDLKVAERDKIWQQNGYPVRTNT